MQREQRPLIDKDLTVSLLLALVVLGVVLALTSCRTVESIKALPEEWWISTWMVVESLILDLADIIKLFI